MTIDTTSGVGVDMFADVGANVLAAVMVGLRFIVPTPLADSSAF